MARAFALHMSGILRHFLRDFEGARQRLASAVETFDELELPHLANAARTTLMIAEEYSGRFEEALRINAIVAQAAQDPFLCYNVAHNATSVYVHAGKPEIAACLALALDQHLPAKPVVQARRLWRNGRISFGLGALSQAAEYFGAARDIFLAQGSTVKPNAFAYEAAVLTLDTCEVYLAEGTHELLAEAAREAAPIFRALGVAREGIVALTYLRQCEVRFSAGAALLAQARVYVETAERRRLGRLVR